MQAAESTLPALLSKNVYPENRVSKAPRPQPAGGQRNWVELPGLPSPSQPNHTLLSQFYSSLNLSIGSISIRTIYMRQDKCRQSMVQNRATDFR
jgi:hypothetical protein